jgi:hypothetical protein
MVGAAGFDNSGAVLAGLAAMVDGIVAPTATSHRCPGWPCAGLIIPVPALLVTGLIVLAGKTELAGVVTGEPVGKLTWRLLKVGVVAGFSLQEITATQQKTAAQYSISFMVESFAPNQNTELNQQLKINGPDSRNSKLPAIKTRFIAGRPGKNE